MITADDLPKIKLGFEKNCQLVQRNNAYFQVSSYYKAWFNHIAYKEMNATNSLIMLPNKVVKK
jgi:hypothetical protein